MAKKFINIILLFLIISCAGSKESIEQENYEKLKNLVYNQHFEIEKQWANPLRGGMINLIGNPNYIRFSKDSVDIFLPYFGERQIGGGYGNRHGGINYKGEPKNLTITEDPDKRKITLKFNGQQDSENLRFLIELYQDGGANTSVNSSQRDMISFRGNFNVLREKQKQQVDVLRDKQN